MAENRLLKRPSTLQVNRILRRAVIVFGLSYLFWLIFYFDFIHKSLASVASLVDSLALILIPVSLTVFFLAIAVIIVVLTRKVSDRFFVRGVVVTGVFLNLASLVSIWASVILGAAALFVAWRVRLSRMMNIALLCGILATGYALTSQGIWVWSQWQEPEPAAAQLAPPSHEGRRLPSIYVVVVDEFSLSLVNEYTSFMSLPNFSRLAQEGVFFPRAYSVSDDTGQSMGAFYTGRYLEEQFAFDLSSYTWQREHRNLISDLTTLGYPIKLYNDYLGLRPRFPTSPLKVETESSAVVPRQDLVTFAMRHLARQVTFGLYSVPNIGALLQGQPVRTFDLEHTVDQPQFVYFHLFDAHHEYLRNRDGSLHGNPYTKFDDRYDENAARKVADNYFEQILWADTVSGQLVDALLSIPPEERIVVFLSDHGISWREHPYGRGTSVLHSTLVHVPVVLVAPGLAPRIDPQTLPLIDLYPTIIDLLNKAAGRAVLAPPEGIDGLSLFADQSSRQIRTYYAYSLKCKYRLQEENWVLERSFEDGTPCASAPVPARELALTDDAAQRALAAAVPKPLPQMEPGKAKSPPLPPKEEVEEVWRGVMLIEESYLDHNILYYQGRYYGVRHGSGGFSLEKYQAGLLTNVVEGDSVEEVKQKIDALPLEAWEPLLVEEGYQDCNIIRLKDHYYGIPHGTGFSLEKLKAGTLTYAVEGASLEEVKQKIDALPLEAFQPKLVEEGYQGYNILRVRDRYYGIRQGTGGFSMEKLQAGAYVGGASIEEVKSLIDEVTTSGT